MENELIKISVEGKGEVYVEDIDGIIKMQVHHLISNKNNARLNNMCNLAGYNVVMTGKGNVIVYGLSWVGVSIGTDVIFHYGIHYEDKEKKINFFKKTYNYLCYKLKSCDGVFEKKEIIEKALDKYKNLAIEYSAHLGDLVEYIMFKELDV